MHTVYYAICHLCVIHGIGDTNVKKHPQIKHQTESNLHNVQNVDGTLNMLNMLLIYIF